MNPIIFLDFDGVISTSRTYTANLYTQGPDWEDVDFRWIDTTATKLVHALCTKFGAKIVVCSVWRKMYDPDLKEFTALRVLNHFGLGEFVHEAWRTVDLESHDTRQENLRHEEIQQWLDVHDNPPYIILDDECQVFEEARMPHVACDMHNGFLLEHFDKAERMLTDIAKRAEAAKTNPFAEVEIK